MAKSRSATAHHPPQNDTSIILHPLVDLSTAFPPFFVDNLKQVFIHGTGKSGSKFQAIRQQLIESLPTAPPPGPATFVVKCLEALLFVEPPYNEGLSHLLASAFTRLDPSDRPFEDAAIARGLAASLFYSAVARNVHLEPRIVVKLPVLFSFDLKDLGGAMTLGEIDDDELIKAAKAFVEPFILDLIKSRSYTGAVSLLKQFNLQKCDSQHLLVTMANDDHAYLAGEWASYIGKDMLEFLVRHCTEMGQFKIAFRLVQSYKLEENFPDAYYLYRQSSLRKLVRKGLWDVAESIAEEDPQLVEYLLNLAVEDGDAAKIAEICERFQLDHVPLSFEIENKDKGSRFIQLENLVSEENVHWVNTSEGLTFAFKHLSGVTLVGIDCEWKADKVKGAGQSKVSILQVASPELVFVLDLITLAKKDQNALNNFIKSLFHTSTILKLGYSVHNDLKRLLHSYQDIEGFQICDSVLDLQRVVGKQEKGGLSGLAKVVLGSYLDKKTRFSDWECRPLSQRQLHYAALDAMVLLPIYHHICSVQSSPNKKALDWKSHLMTFRVVPKIKKQQDVPSSKDGENAVGDESIMKLPVVVHASHEDLVSATCELLGLPIPGLWKSELLNFTQTGRFPPPVYRHVCMGPHNATVYHCTVKVAGATFAGRPATRKKDAEFWAAQVALKSLDGGRFLHKRDYHRNIRDFTHFKAKAGRQWLAVRAVHFSFSNIRIRTALSIFSKQAPTMRSLSHLQQEHHVSFVGPQHRPFAYA